VTALGSSFVCLFVSKVRVFVCFQISWFSLYVLNFCFISNVEACNSNKLGFVSALGSSISCLFHFTVSIYIHILLLLKLNAIVYLSGQYYRPTNRYYQVRYDIQLLNVISRFRGILVR
jgi:hypothetical protein